MASKLEMQLDREYLISIIKYDQQTGTFRWKISKLGVTKGSIAGGIQGAGYWVIKINYERYLGHRLAWFYVHGKWPKDQIDHINGRRADNRISNLRETNQQENCKNRRVTTKNLIGVMGVYWEKQRNKYSAKIGVNRKTINIGRFDLLEEAVKARKNAEIIYGFHPNHGRVA